MAYDFKSVEEKWRKRWDADGLGEVDVRSMRGTFYILTMFPYPSGDKLHMGHWYQYGIVDSWARFQRMTGKPVFQPMGFDAFGLPAENYAIKNGIHPDKSTTKNVEVMVRQFKEMGVSYAWKYLLNTSKPDYYRWTQWLFLQLHKNGLAYRKDAAVNWCPSCQTVLANEQVQDGQCERCESVVSQKYLKQWFFKITQYADKLLNGIAGLNWPDRTKSMQTHWIGRSEGAELDFTVAGAADTAVTVFTTRPDTLYGVTYLVLAPEHPLVTRVTTPDRKVAMEAYIAATAKLSELDRQSTVKEKSGVFTGSHAVSPLTGEKVPIWVGDYVLVTYGSGAVMAVPAHDERDFAFAKTYGLPIRKVILESGTVASAPLEQAFTGAGTAVHCGPHDGLPSDKLGRAIVDELEKKHSARRKVNFRLRDWLVSRQRYWGVPIPILYCAKCGEVPVPESDLPVRLPEDVDFKPTGESPLKRCASFVAAKCPKCGGAAEREVDTLDTFVCSSWYFLRFPNVGDDTKAFDPELTNRILPVDHYIGGPEHACMHLLYARFVTMVLKDLGYLKFSEPFPTLTHQGLVLGRDGQKMSKSKGNAVSPDPYIEKHGSDGLRLYLMFGFNYVEGGPWEDGGFKAVIRFLDRMSRLFDDHLEIMKSERSTATPANSEDTKLLHLFNTTIQRMTVDTERFQFNTSIARMMELLNGLSDYTRAIPKETQNLPVVAEILRKFVVLLAPFAPHFAEEYWETLGAKKTIFDEPWPRADAKYLQLDTIKMAVMIDGKLRAEIEVPASAGEDEIRAVALADEKVKLRLEGQKVVKSIVVPKRLVNFILGK